MSKTYLLGFVVALGLTSAALADTITLTNGRQFHGKVISETADQIKVKSGGGVLTFPRDQVKSIARNDKGLEDPKPRPKPRDGDGDGDGDGDEGGLDKQALEKQLEQLGPSGDDREDALTKLSSEEKQGLNGAMQRLGRLGRRNNNRNPAAIRNRARDEIASKYGLKAVPRLLDWVDDESYWKSRMSVETLTKIARNKPEDAKWLLFRLKALPKAFPLLVHSGEPGLSPGMRMEANSFLEAASGHEVGMRVSTSDKATAVEQRGKAAWEDWWKTAKKAYDKAEKTAERKRRELKRKLKDAR